MAGIKAEQRHQQSSHTAAFEGAYLGAPLGFQPASNHSPATSTPAQSYSAHATPASSSNKRKRTVSQAPDSSPGDENDEDEGDNQEDQHGNRRKGPGVRRACNQCRQQKLRCDVSDGQACSRCNKHGLECKIDPNFKRIGKRSKQAEMEREIVELRQATSALQRQLSLSQSSTHTPMSSGLHIPTVSTFGGFGTSSDHNAGTNDAAAGLLDLSQGIEGGAAFKRLGNVLLDAERVQELFDEYFRYYHPFLAFLDSSSPQQFYEASPLLFWTIISIAARHYKKDPDLLTRLNEPLTRLVWDTAAQVPQSHHVVKALCLLCIWPLPVTTTAKDPTLQLCGLMMSMAKQIGLHRPTHAQDFARFSVQLKDEDIRDRMQTWAVCNIVAQNVSTGYGQPAETLYDSTLFPPTRTPGGPNTYYLTSALEEQLRIAVLCNDITAQLYSSPSHTLDFGHDEHRIVTAGMLTGQFNKLAADFSEPGASGLHEYNNLYVYAANLHLCLSALFQPSSSKTYQRDLLSLWFAVKALLERAIGNNFTSIPPVAYFPNYLMQMILAAGYTLLRLLDSFFANSIDQSEGRHLLASSINFVRQMSVRSNDLPQRMAEVLAQMWKASQSGWLKGVNSTRRSVSPQAMHHTPRASQSSPVSTFHGSPFFTPLNRAAKGRALTAPSEEPDDSLQLQVRYRMSMSVVYDSVLLWREEVQGKVRAEELDKAVKDPTRLEVSGKNTPAPDGAFAAAGGQATAGAVPVSGGMAPFQFDGMAGAGGVAGLYGGSGLETGMELHDVFDPFPFVLDGMGDFVPFPLGLGE